MFGRNASIIYISRTVIAVVPSGANLSDADNFLKYEWNEEILEQIFTDLVSKAHINRIHILLAEDLSYCARVSIEHTDNGYDSSLIASKIKDEMLKVFPEYEENLAWDHKRMYKIDYDTYYQVVGTPKNLLAKIVRTLESLNVNVISVEPIAYSIARLTMPQESVHIIVYKSELENFFTLADKGSVLMTQSFVPEDFAGALTAFVRYIRGAYSLPAQLKMVTSKNLSENLNAEGLQQIGIDITVETMGLDPFLSMQKKDDIKGKDDEVLSIPTSELNEKDTAQVQSGCTEWKDKLSSLKTNRLTYMVLFLLIMLFLAGYMLFNYLNKDDSLADNQNAPQIESADAEADVSEEVPEAVVEEPDAIVVEGVQLQEEEPETEIEVPQPLVLSDYGVNILNGSGIAGEAGRVSNILTDSGFTDIETGNADEFDYTITTIKIKNLNEADAIFSELSSVLLNYDLSLSDVKLADDYTYDIEIIVGAPS